MSFKMAEFSTLSEALNHRAQYGGWVFVRENATNAVWFDAAYYTPAAIFRHPAAAGSGRLI